MTGVNATATSPTTLSVDMHPDGLTERTHRFDVDVLRVVAAVMIVTIHVTSVFIAKSESAGQSGGTYWVALISNLLSRGAVPTFFAISGWAVMRNSTVRDEVGWLGQRLARLLVPLIVWNIIYMGVAYLVASATGRSLTNVPGWPTDWLLHELALILAGPGTAANLWFLYFLVPLTLLFWVIRVAPKAITDTRTRWVFGGAIVVLILPYGVVGAFDLNLAWSAFGWAVGYAVLGYVLLSMNAPRRRVSVPLFVGATLGLIATEQLFGYDRWEMSNSGPLVFAQTIGLIGVVRSIQIGDRWRRPLANAATLTFGVYFVHLVFVHVFRVTLGASSLPQLLVLAISWLGTATLSFAVAATWHRRPTLRRILG